MATVAAYSLQDALINLLSDYLPMPCLLTLSKKPAFSYGLGPVPSRTHPLYFEVEFGRMEQRAAHNRRQMQRKDRAPFVAEHAGLQDLFVPLFAPGPGPAKAWITLGAFQKALPEPADLWKRWCALRRAPSADDAEAYLLFARSIYETPVLHPETLDGLGTMLTSVGLALLGHAGHSEALRAVERAKREALGAGLPWRMWHYTEARRDRYHRGPFQGAELAPWDAAEFKLKKGPDTALAFVPKEAPGSGAAALHQAAQLQIACFEHCRQKPGLVAGKLGDEGALILAAATRLQARDLAMDAAQGLSRALGWRVACAWQCRPGQREDLDRTIRAAENGLRTALARGQDLAEATVAAADVEDGWNSAELGEKLGQLAAEGRFEGARLLRADLVEGALKASAGRIEALRVHLQWGLSPLLQAAQRRLGPGAGDGLRPHAAAALGASLSSGDLLRRFETESEELFARLQDPAMGGLTARLRQAAARLKEHPEEHADLRGLAREAGLSPFHFSREFKRLAGLGFAQARLQARLDKARRLLRESPIPVEAVAVECGFRNAAHFSTAFKKDQGQSPKAFRDAQRQDNDRKTKK
jgi:AraC-like DNA-binding protein